MVYAGEYDHSHPNRAKSIDARLFPYRYSSSGRAVLGRRDMVRTDCPIAGLSFSDIWTIYDDEETEQWLEYRTKIEQKEREMIENQFEDLRG